jgi:hypothetical protein
MVRVFTPDGTFCMISVWRPKPMLIFFFVFSFTTWDCAAGSTTRKARMINIIPDTGYDRIFEETTFMI